MACTGREIADRVERQPLGLEGEGAMSAGVDGGLAVDPVRRRLAKVARGAAEDVLRPEELGHIGGGRLPEHLRRRTRLEHAPGVEEDRLVAEEPRLREIVRHLERREPPRAVEITHLTAHEGAPSRVERTERLVEEEKPRAAREGARQRDELSLPSGESTDVAGEQRCDAEALDDFMASGRITRAVGDVLRDGEVGEEVRLLVDQPDVTGFGGNPAPLDAIKQDAPRSGRDEPREDLQQRRLPRTGGPDHHPVRSRLQREGDLRQAEASLRGADALEPDHASSRRSTRSARSTVSGTRARRASAAATGRASRRPKLVKRS